MVFRKGRVDPLRPRACVGPTGEREWIPLPVLQVYLFRVANAGTLRALDDGRQEAEACYAGESLGELAKAVAAQKRELDPEGADIDESIDFGPVPPETMALWLEALATMEREALDSFIRRMRRTWAASELAPLEAAVAARRRALGR